MKTLKRTAALESAGMERTGTEGFDGPSCELTLELIASAVMAGRNHEAARQGGLGAGGFRKLGQKHSHRTAILADELAMEAAIALLGAAHDSLDFDEV